MSGSGSWSGRIPAASCWDVVVVGAGPAGSMTALLAAERGLRVLLIERQQLPRAKVCGCCLNPAALDLLSKVGIGVAELGSGTRLEDLLLCGWGHRVAVRLPGGLAVGRDCLDAGLAAVAAERGARIVTLCNASIGGAERGARRVVLSAATDRVEVRARLVVDASGLGSAHDSGEARQQRRHRVGLGTTVRSAVGYRRGTVTMAAGTGGYVGLVWLSERALNVAASVPVEFLRRQGGAGAAVNAVLREAGLSPLGDDADWRGTPPLRSGTRRPDRRRIVAVGDAAGFWEPFTGEGIAWALESGWRTGRALPRLLAEWSPTVAHRWRRDQSRWLARRQLRSRVVAAAAQRPRVARTALRLATVKPRWIGRAIPAATPRRAPSAGGWR